MSLEELYAKVGGDYADIMQRLQMEQLVVMILSRFPEDESCPRIIAAWEAGDEEAAFRAAHAAKGVCGNLSLTKLANITSQITEALRPGNEALRAETDVDALVEELKREHELTISEIKAYTAG